MDSQFLTTVTWSFGLACGAYSLFAIRLWAGRGTWKSERISRLLFWAVVFTALWGAGGFAFGMTKSGLWLLVESLFDTLRYGAWFAFLLQLLAGSQDGIQSGLPARRGLVTLGVFLVLSALALQIAVATGLQTTTSLPSYALASSMVLQVFALVLLEQVLRNVLPDSLWDIKPLCLGFAGAFLFDLYLFSDALLFKRLDNDVFSVRGLIHALILPLLAASNMRTKAWSTKIRMSQKAVFRSATLVIVGAYLLFIAGVGYYVRVFGGEWGRALQAAMVFAALLGLGILVFSRSIRAKLRVLIVKHFFSYRYDYREEWLRFTNTLSTQQSPQAMGEQVIRGLAELVESPSGAIWLRDPSRPEFEESSRWNVPAVNATERADSPFCHFMTESGWVIDLEEYRSFPRRYESLRLPEWLSQIPNAWLIVPLAAAHELTGFVVLSRARTSVDINWEVNDLLRTAGRQAASFLAQMHATEALLEVRKFDAFNRMSAFVVHDLKNIVTQLSLLLKNAERHRDKPEFQQDMLMTVQHSVERMRQLMLQLREGATPPGTPVGVELAAIVERIQATKAAGGRKVEVVIDERLMTRGHEERIERVIGHLVQNALDASDGRDARTRVWITLSRQGGSACVEVGDTGHGMSPEFIRERLFKPFQTTKQAGMGIGAYESFQYIQEIGGKISVDSEVDVGTRITMLLPLFEAGAKSDLHQLPHEEAA